MEKNVAYKVCHDAEGNKLTGVKNYVFHLPPNIPAKEYWSVIVYDSQTKFIIKNNQLWPSVYRTSKRLVVNLDGSVDVRFGPEVPDGSKTNWIQTLPGKEWTLMLRLYGVLESWFDQSWKPGEVKEIVKK